MKKTLLLLCALLGLGISGAWAATAVTEVKDGRYYKLRFRYNCINWVKADLTLDGGRATASDQYTNGSETNAGVFKFTKSDDVWYVQEVSSGKYVYATSAVNSSGATDGRLALGSTSLPVATSGDAVENLNYYKWVITDNTNATAISYSEAKSPKNISPNLANTIAWGLYSDTGRNGATVNFWNKNYQYGGAEFYRLTTSELYTLGASLAELKVCYIDEHTFATKDLLGYPTSAGVTAFETAINAISDRSSFLTEAATALSNLYNTIVCPSNGHYYIKGLAYNNYMLYDEALTNYGYAALLNGATTAKQLWKVVANGKTPTVTSSIGKPIANNSGSFSPITLSSGYENDYSSAYGYFYFNDFHSPNSETQANSYAYNTDEAYSNSNPMRAISYNNTQGSGNYWTFVSADDDYDIYDVVIVDPLSLSPTLTCTLDGYTGNTVVYNGGFYAFTKDTEISTSNFTAQSEDLEGYDTSVTTVAIAGKTITVTYTLAKTWTEYATEYLTNHAIATKMAASVAGTVGYPKTSSTGYMNLSSMTSKVEFTEDDYNNLVAYYNAYLADTNINLPIEGKTYTFVNFHKNGTKKYLYNNSGVLAVATLAPAEEVPSSGYFVAHQGLDGKYFFVAKGTTYHFDIAKSGNANMTVGYSSTYSPVELTKMPSSVTNTTSASFSYSVDEETVFGGIYFKGMRTDNQAGGIIIVKRASDGFESFHTFPVFHDNFSTAFYVNTVDAATETYYNTVNMRKAGTHSYASAYLPFAVQLPDGVKAYKATSRSNDVLLLSKIADGSDNENNVLPAQTAAVLWSENAAVTGNQTLTIVNSNLTAPTDNVLDGTLADNTTVSATTYVLYGDASSAGFYPLSGTTAPTCKAYYDAGVHGVKSFRFAFFDGEDAIEEVKIDEKSNSVWYDLSGRRVNVPVKGLYIVNGKKVLVK